MRTTRFAVDRIAFVVAVALLGALAPPAFAQNEAVIIGRVASDQGEPLAGATVSVNHTNFGAATNSSGVFSIVVGAATARGQEVFLTARAIGFKAQSRQVRLSIGTQEQNFVLAADPLRLDELVVTGVSEATSTRKLTFSVGRVSEAQLQVAPAVTALGALQGKVAGVAVFTPSGMPGTEPLIKLRGATSITGNQNPLIIVDGTITRYSLADIASEDIERVEVLKGAAASSLYGSDAANGVIQIFTRRGANLPEGKLQVTARLEGGQSFITGLPAASRHHAYLLLPNGDFYRRADSSRVIKSQCDATDAQALVGGVCPPPVDTQDGRYPTYFNAREALYDPGRFFTQYISVGQNEGRTNFNVSFQNTRNEGSVFNLKGLRRQNYRVNIDQVLSDRVDLSVNAFYGHSENEEPSQGGRAGPFHMIIFLEPHVDPTVCCNPDGSPFKAFIRDRLSNTANPLYDLYNVQRDRERSRASGGGRFRYRPFSWLSTEVNYNYDQLSEEFIQAQPFTYYTSSGTRAVPGRYDRESRNNRTYNAGFNLTGVWRLDNAGPFRNLGVTTKVAYLYEDQLDHWLRASASRFVVKDVPEFAGTDPAGQQADSEDIIMRNRNVFAIGTLDFDERVILDGLVRRDGSSLFGPGARWATYWRASAAIRVPQLLGWNGGPEELRLRAAYGTAGLRPTFFGQYEVLAPSAGAFTKEQLGNRDLRPAKSQEFEIGANLELASGRFTVEYSYSDKETCDQIIDAPLPGTSGFQSQWQNVGALEAKTHELTIRAQVVSTRDIALQVNLTADRARETITEWPLPDDDYEAFEGVIFAPGVRWGTMRGGRWVRNLDQLYQDPAKKAASGPGQVWSSDSVVVNSDGYVVRRSLRGTNGERPIQLVECAEFDPADPTKCITPDSTFYLGVAAPDFRAGLNTTFAYKRFAVTGLLDWSKGGHIFNGTASFAFVDCVDIRCDQSGKPAGDRIAQGFYTNGLRGNYTNEAFVESATFVKLRELSVSYTFNRNELRRVGLGRVLTELRVGVVGRNLFTWTPYSGIDPEVAPEGFDPFKLRADIAPYPPFRTLTGFIEIAF